MNRLFNHRPLAKTGIIAILLLPFLFLINDYSPESKKIPQGYSSSIVAFEFASNNDELITVLSPLNRSDLRDMDRLNYVDFGFMILYGIFLFLTMSRLGTLHGHTFLRRMRWLVLIAVIADAIENIHLLKLTDYFRGFTNSQEGLIFWLSIFTWIKWLLLALSLSAIGYSLVKAKKYVILGTPLLLIFVLGIVARITLRPVIEDSFAGSVFLGFFLVWILCFLYRIHPKPTTLSE